ncbi:MAG: DUF1207 domain-containing protein [Pirellulales bacterium]|nr:DUF1207 domain-containing protein [Pirellulales bacterium]
MILQRDHRPVLERYAAAIIAGFLMFAARAAGEEPVLMGGMPPLAAAQWGPDTVGTPPVAQPVSPDQAWVAPPYDPMQSCPPAAVYADPGWGEAPVVVHSPGEAWFWQAMPDGLIYHSYWAGVREPRLGIVMQHISSGHSFFDGTAGGRAGLLRYGNGSAIFPQGWQLDVEAAALVRLTLDEIRDFETADYRVGVPLTYGVDQWQFKLAVYHLSSHLGDEYAIANPGSLADRINYVRDEVVFGASYYPVPVCRLYSEIGYAFNTDGGAEPLELQFGTELARPGPTGPAGTPFFAINGHLREEVDFGGDLSTQVGWLWRGNSGQVVRTGFHYYNGKSSQYQTFNQFEQQFGFGMWFDF